MKRVNILILLLLALLMNVSGQTFSDIPVITIGGGSGGDSDSSTVARSAYAPIATLDTNPVKIITSLGVGGNFGYINPVRSDSTDITLKSLKINLVGTKIDSAKVVSDSLIFYSSGKRFKMIKY